MRNKHLDHASDINDEVVYSLEHPEAAPSDREIQEAILSALVGIGEILESREDHS